MRVEETCRCGAGVVVVFGGSSFVHRDERETKEAWAMLDAFRAAHDVCRTPPPDDPKETTT